MRVIFRCDSTKSQGLGHVIRSVAVADAALEAGWSVEFCGTVDSAMGRDLINARGGILHQAPADAQSLARLAADRGADVVHLDSYAEQGELLGALAARGVVLSSVEDFGYGRRRADVVVDPSPASEERYRPDDGSLRILRGAKAIPLRKSLLRLPPHTVRAAEAEEPVRIMIIMGGTDALNSTGAIAGLWLRTGLASECHIVGNAAGTAIAVEPGPRQRLVFHEPGPSVPDLFPGMDLVISGAGTTIWELAFLGVPMALVQLVDNQGDNYGYAVSSSLAVGLGQAGAGRLDEQHAITALADLATSAAARTAMSARSRQIVDGAGSTRLVRIWSELVAHGGGMHARCATVDDASRLFDWRNEPSVRSVSRTSAELDWSEHLDWVKRTIAAPDRCLLIIEADGKSAGTVRFDLMDPGSWEVSITVSPELRGQHRAAAILDAGEKYFLAANPAVTLLAEMRESNAASYRLFRAAGYSGQLRTQTPERWYHLRK